MFSRIRTDNDLIENILNRGVEDVFVKENLEKKLKSGKKLRVKLGFDPTGSKIHIGRAIVLRKLKKFQDLGHQIIFLVGDFTAKIGDPSDKLEKRPMLTNKDIKENLKNYKEQVSKIIDLKKAEFVFNSKWLSKLKMEEITELAETFSVQQMLNRRNFKERIESGQEVSLREFLYPLMQGYDSVQLKVDVEVGGFDQLFNLKAGRIIQKHYGQKEQDILTTQMLEGTDGRKMSTSWGNVINITDNPNDMYGKVMAIKDDLVSKYFLLCTDVSESEIKKIVSGNRREAKMKLAFEIVSIYHGEKKAEEAKDYFVKVFSNKEVPEKMLEVKVSPDELVIDVVLNSGVVKSKTEFRRLVNEGAVVDLKKDEKIKDPNLKITKNELILRIGKKNFIKLKLEN